MGEPQLKSPEVKCRSESLCHLVLAANPKQA